MSYSLPTFRFLARVLASPFFWLHIKKSAGSSLRRLLQPHYRCVDRSINPCCFVGVSKEYWNDTVNNYRIPLGEFQFRRASFARKYLYGKDWERMNSFAFVREPVSRALSMFRFLQPEIRSYAISLRISKCSPSDLFDLFLKMLLLQRESSISSKPFGLRFSTHVNPAWNDVVDVDGNVLIANLFRLEDLERGLSKIYAKCGLELPKTSPSIYNQTSRSGRSVLFCQLSHKKQGYWSIIKKTYFFIRNSAFASVVNNFLLK